MQDFKDVRGSQPNLILPQAVKKSNVYPRFSYCDKDIFQMIFSLLLLRADETQPGRKSCPWLHFGFQFGRYHVVVALSVLRSISLVLTLFVFTFLADLIFSRSYVHQQHFRSRSLCHLFTRNKTCKLGILSFLAVRWEEDLKTGLPQTAENRAYHFERSFLPCL